MFATPTSHRDFVDTRAMAPEPAWAVPAGGRGDTLDVTELLATADAADRQLLRLVLCAAAATLLLALAGSLSL